ncbi:MAG TPA: hypothetical protein P5121_00330 [Caldilineaceae bacterium]|nr:hypothetical protein [Caldilineaceae bacterium]
MILTLIDTRGLRAHGGVVIDSGFTDYFEWLVSISPYPVTTGEATITLLVYDIATYSPVNNLKVMLYATGPEASQAELDQRGNSVDLIIDPAIYPGDYSENIPLDQIGEWRLQFVVEGADKSFEITVPVQVAAAPLVEAPLTAVTPDRAATATVFAQNIESARQQNSPLSAPVSPLASNNPVEDATTVMDILASANFLGIAWWLWGIVAVIPIIMSWLLLRSPGQTAIDEVYDELDTSGDNRSANDNQSPADAALKERDV